ncbi:MAG: glycosyltransferase family 2 protein [Gemmatimonadota bacterium]
MSISVVIPTYNYGRFLPEAIRSVRQQTVADREIVEIIVVDDCSTDETPDLLAAIDDPRLTVIRFEENRGIADARNAGLERARGEFVAYLDADDRWKPDKLERQLEVMRAEPSVGLLFTDLERFDENGRFDKTHFSYVPELARMPGRPSEAGDARIFTSDPFCTLLGLPIFPIMPQTTMVRAEAGRGLHWPDRVRLAEGIRYFLGLAMRADVGYLPSPLTEVRRHGRNTFSPGLEISHHVVRQLSKLEDTELTTARRAALLHGLGRRWAGIGYLHFWNRRPAAAAAAYFRCLTYPGSRWNAVKHLALLLTLPFLRRQAQA